MKHLYLSIILILISFAKIYAQVSEPCNVSFTYDLNSESRFVSFNDSSRTANNIIRYYWSFGDGNYSHNTNPSHVYSEPGIYVVCVTIITDDSCKSTFCDTINIMLSSIDTSNCYSISGHVNTRNSVLPFGAVLLYRYDTAYNRYIASYYTSVYEGYYNFDSLPQGTYLLHAVPYFDLNTPYYPYYLPTYYGNNYKWENAEEIQLTSSLFDIDIDLIYNPNIIFGQHTIQGNISIADPQYFEYNIFSNNIFGYGPGNNIDPVAAPNQIVLLTDMNDNPYKVAISDENGNFSINYLPVEKFKLFVEKAGLTSIPYIIDLAYQSSQNPVYFYLDQQSIYSGINEVTNEFSDFSIKAYPSPASTIINLSISTNILQQITSYITDITGKVIYSDIKDCEPGQNLTNINISQLKAGIYVLNSKNESGQTSHFRFIKY